MAKRIKPTPALPNITADTRTSLESVNRATFNETIENAIRTNLAFPKDGTEDFEAPVPFLQVPTAELPDAAEWEGSMAYDTDLEQVVWSNGTAWVPLASGPVGTSVDLLTDPNADRILFWDDSDNAADWLIPVAPLSISGNNLQISTADETDVGVVDLATDAEIRSAATGAHGITADALETAAALVSLTESSGTIAVDWDTFINGIVTVDQTSVISNPTNGQPGTWRTIIVQGNDATNRTVTFGNQYIGPNLTDITDADNAKFYLVAIYCQTASLFWASCMASS